MTRVQKAHVRKRAARGRQVRWIQKMMCDRNVLGARHCEEYTIIMNDKIISLQVVI